MKKDKIYALIVLLLIIAGSNAACYAQNLPPSGSWETGISIGNEVEIDITGDITIKGQVSITSGGTLKINNKTNSDITLTYAGSTGFFSVESGGKLIIQGNEQGSIIIDGGANFNLANDNITLTSSNSKKINQAIYNAGRVDLNYVTIQNVYSSNNNGAALEINASGNNNNKGTYLNNCVITKCKALLGSALMIQGSSPVYITDSKILYCNTGGGAQDNSGGAIRTYGSTSSSLFLTNVKFFYNYALRNSNYNNSIPTDGNGGALFWNAKGAAGTRCEINGCEFAYNKSDDNGGAIKAQSALYFVGDTTKFHHNTAPVGAAIYIEGYTGGAGVSKVDNIVYDLNSYLKVYQNSSPNYTYNSNTYPGQGAGIHFFFGPDMRLQSGTKITVNLNGAKIYSNVTGDENSTHGEGGGIYFEKSTEPNKYGNSYKYEINMDFGKVYQNISYGQGGGVFVSEGDINSKNINNQALEIRNNTSAEGGGIYINNGNLKLANGAVTGNNSKVGGGIYINNGDFTINAGNIEGNNANSGNGGGVYIVGQNGKGVFTMAGGTINANESSADGGGAYINGGKFILQQGTGSITGNISNNFGGGVCIVNGGTFEMNGGSITDNGKVVETKKTINGGGVYLNGGNFKLSSGIISGNAVTGNGGGVFLTGENCVYELFNGDIINNKAEYGGGVYLESGKFILGTLNSENGNISENSAVQGGGVYIGSVQTKAGESSSTTSEDGFVMNGGKITSNNTTDNGGGIYLQGGDFNQYGGIIQTNTSQTNGGGIYLVGGSFNLHNGTVQGNYAAKGGGGIYLSGGNFTMSDGDITLNGVRVVDAVTSTTESGGGVYLSGGSFKQQGGEITSNISTAKGGGVCIVGGGNFNMENGFITANGRDTEGKIITENGGGVYLENGNFTLGTSNNPYNGTINGNGADYGGGVYLKGGSFVQNYGSLDGNIAEFFGGGLCILGGEFTIKNGLIKNNGKENSSDNSSDNSSGTPVTDNGGGVYMNNGTLTVLQGKIINNASSEYGGGIYILNGTVEMGEGFIDSNTCSKYGGGVYVYNEAAVGNLLPVNFSGGIIQKNNALYGGGICVNGRIELNIDGAQILNNTAVNGGGVCLMNNALMKFGDGWVTGNTASPKEDNAIAYSGKSAFEQEIESLEGIGGGIYLDSDTELIFNPDNRNDYALGLFQNIAFNGADELFANGKNTSVTIPNVALMANLQGFTGAGSLTWVEDYITYDKNYKEGTNIFGNKWDADKPQNLRYRTMQSQNETNLPQFTGGETYTNYVCFALGFETIYITIVKNGLAAGESAIFSLSKEGANNVKPIRIILTGTEESNAVSQMIGVTAGNWTVTETPWSWSYTPLAQSLKQDVTDPNKRTFEFTNSKAIENNSSINSQTILYDEKAVVKTMTTGSGGSN